MTQFKLAKPATGCGFPTEPIKEIYDGTKARSPLPRYIVDYFLFKSSRETNWTELIRNKTPKDHLKAEKFEFVLEC